MNKQNVWDELEAQLRVVFPYPYPETMDNGYDKEDYYESRSDPLIPFLTGENVKPHEQLGIAANGIEFVEFEGSFYENMDYDSIPQGTEDECDAVIKVYGEFYKVGLYFTSWSGYRLSEVAHKVSPKTVEVVVYE